MHKKSFLFESYFVIASGRIECEATDMHRKVIKANLKRSLEKIKTFYKIKDQICIALPPKVLADHCKSSGMVLQQYPRKTYE